MTFRYYLFGIVLLTGILYFSKEMRDKGIMHLLPSMVTDLIPTNVKESSPRHVKYDSHQDVKETHMAMKEKDALQEWIQSRLTQSGLKEMTESGHYQSDYSGAL